MNFKIIATWIFLCCNFVVTVAKTNAAITKRIFKMNIDQTQIDEKTRSFILNRKSLLGKVEKLKLKIPGLKHVCKIDRYLKTTLCERLLEIDSHGFILRPSRGSDLDCAETELYIKLPTLKTSEFTKLLMYSCPTVSYIDLETGEQTILPYTYRISIAKNVDAALLLVHERQESTSITAYTQGYVTDISFSTLKFISKHTRVESYSHKLPLTSKTDDMMRHYAWAKQINSPYEKFIKFYSSINVCGRRRSQNVCLCRQSVMKAFELNDNMKFDFLGYDERSCRKHQVILVSTEWDEIAGKFNDLQVELFMFRCPTVQMKYLPPNRTYFHLTYLASNLSTNSAALFIRNNLRWRDLPSPYASIYNLDMQPIIKDIRRRRFLPRPMDEVTSTHSVPRRRSEPVSLVATEVRTPSTLVAIHLANKSMKWPKTEESVSVNTDRWFTEMVLISFSEVKNMKLAYQRFAKTYKSIDFCQLSVKQKIAFCEDAFEEYYGEGRHSIILNGTMKFPCERHRVTLSTRESVHLKTTIHFMWECPSLTSNDDRAYFVGKNHLMDSAVAYKRVRIYMTNYYYPYALIGQINRHKLAKAEIVI